MVKEDCGIVIKEEEIKIIVSKKEGRLIIEKRSREEKCLTIKRRETSKE